MTRRQLVSCVLLLNYNNISNKRVLHFKIYFIIHHTICCKRIVFQMKCSWRKLIRFIAFLRKWTFPLIYISIWRATCWWNENKWQCYLQRDNVLFQNAWKGPCFALMTVKCSKWDRQKTWLTHSRRHEKWPSFFSSVLRQRMRGGEDKSVYVCVLLKPLCVACETKRSLNQKKTLLIYMMSKC